MKWRGRSPCFVVAVAVVVVVIVEMRVMSKGKCDGCCEVSMVAMLYATRIFLATTFDSVQA